MPAQEGSAVVTGSPPDFAAFLRQNRERWAKLMSGEIFVPSSTGKPHR